MTCCQNENNVLDTAGPFYYPKQITTDSQLQNGITAGFPSFSGYFLFISLSLYTLYVNSMYYMLYLVCKKIFNIILFTIYQTILNPLPTCAFFVAADPDFLSPALLLFIICDSRADPSFSGIPVFPCVTETKCEQTKHCLNIFLLYKALPAL